MYKKKICDGCGKERVIWKNDSGKRYCQFCWNKLKKPTGKIKSQSHSRQIDNSKYRKLRVDYLLNHPICEARFSSECSLRATDIHHKYDGSDRNLHLLDTNTWIAVCRECHEKIHKNTTLAKQQNLLL